MPERSYSTLLGGGAIKSWTAEEVGKLNYVLPGSNNTIRDKTQIQYTLDLKFKP